MVNFINSSDSPVGVPGTEIYASPGQVVSVPDGYALPRRIGATDNKRPSIIEMVCPQLTPADEDARMRIATEFAEDAAQRKSQVSPRTREALVAMGYNPAIADLMVQRDMALLATKAPELVANLEEAKKAAREEARRAIKEELTALRASGMSAGDAAEVLATAAKKGKKE